MRTKLTPRATIPPLLTAKRDALAADADTIGRLRNLADGKTPLAREAGYLIRNADDEEAVVRIYDEIWWLGINAQDLVADLDAITAPKMRVEINSPGGDVFDGIAIYNALRSHPAQVTTRVDGIAASIASIIAQAGDVRIMQPAAQMMIHNAWGLTVGDTRDHADMVELLAQQDEILAGIYAGRSGRDVDHFRDLMNAETWLTGQRAVDEGLADVVVDPNENDAPSAKARTLHDEIVDAVDAVSDAISSAERVAALRADAGKDLSVVNREGLAGLLDAAERLRGLLTETEDNEGSEVWTDVELAEMRGRLAALTGHPTLGVDK